MWVWLPLMSWFDWCHVFSLNVSLLTTTCIPAKHLTSLLNTIVCILGCRLWELKSLGETCYLCVRQRGLLTVTEWSTCFWQQPPSAFHRLTQTLEGVKNTYEWIFTCEIQTTVAVTLSKPWAAVWPEESNCPWHNWLNFIETTSFVLPLTT